MSVSKKFFDIASNEYNTVFYDLIHYILSKYVGENYYKIYNDSSVKFTKSLFFDSIVEFLIDNDVSLHLGDGYKESVYIYDTLKECGWIKEENDNVFILLETYNFISNYYVLIKKPKEKR